MICLQDYMGYPIAKATVVAYPCIDMYIKDQPDENVKDWVSVMVEVKRRASTLDFLPCRISKQDWSDVGKNSLLTWPINMIGRSDEYELFVAEQYKVKRQIKKRRVLPPTPIGNGAARRRLPFPVGAPQLAPPYESNRGSSDQHRPPTDG
ncbi:uncharacterized protein LOC110460023 [Mizuhopecten yessoensis]|nr:uncharacterized protein LOC110460023 [Mizuhopecten yessoensis]